MTDRTQRSVLLVTAILASSTLAFAQEPPQPAPQPPPPPQQSPAPQPTPPPATPEPEPPGVLSSAASGAYERRDSFPSVNIYVPEGQASVRIRKLIKNVLFESQIDYRFVNGDISTFLRYKYYSRNYTYKLGVFDTIGFPDIGSRSTQEFERVRGGLLLTEFPRDYNHRYFVLLQDDRLTFGDVTQVDNRKNNIYTKFGYQFGTQFDERMNAIVGETRGRIVPVLTAFREIGPQKLSFAVAFTESARISTGDYKYTKFETEALRRWDISPTSFIVTRAHIGAFLTKTTIREWCQIIAGVQSCGTGTPPPGAVAVPSIERYSIPAYEMFTLGGREALKSVHANDASAGTNELHLTNEYFVPVFRNRDYRTFAVHWNTLYGIGYVGVGNVGYSYSAPVKVRDYAVDAGLGSEASITLRDYEVLLSIVGAHTLRGPAGIRGNKVLVSLRTSR
jgi:hypothetical protein